MDDSFLIDRITSIEIEGYPESKKFTEFVGRSSKDLESFLIRNNERFDISVVTIEGRVVLSEIAKACPRCEGKGEVDETVFAQLLFGAIPLIDKRKEPCFLCNGTGR